MISESIINAILKVSDAASKDNVIKELVNHFNVVYDYGNNYKNHILEMLVDKKAIITEDNIDIYYVEENISKFIYNAEQYNIKDITLDTIDNIDCVVRCKYKRTEIINKDGANNAYVDDFINISYIEYPQVLKKS